MPMDFPDLKSLKATAKVHNFRQPDEGETEKEFREALHLHVKSVDTIESFEIKFGVGWNKWTYEQKNEAICC